jgi:hypothetical protein
MLQQNQINLMFFLLIGCLVPGIKTEINNNNKK